MLISELITIDPLYPYSPFQPLDRGGVKRIDRIWVVTKLTFTLFFISDRWSNDQILKSHHCRCLVGFDDHRTICREAHF
ncbi:hypothetical protein B9Z55_023724 [Caenorhabditis nigoni]|uniref:Uncharacterized protein n=1 Tax=Caenorhabditis nigoni TaxID=1611254 RepID=A0A2G5SQV8_9PELO|nr:hypothetical protein B9Z55_023724 [Caenorhabditis nigoni]